jgi:hypothetical protein
LTKRATLALCFLGVAVVCLIAGVVADVNAEIAASKPPVRVPIAQNNFGTSEGAEFPAPPPRRPQAGMLGQVEPFGKVWFTAGGIGLLLYLWLLNDLRDISRRVEAK